MRKRVFFQNLLILSSVLSIILLLYHSYLQNPLVQLPVAPVKNGNRWIVVTSISYPTEDVKRLASIPDWNLVVVFQYEDTVSGIRYRVNNVNNESEVTGIILQHADPKTGLDIKFNKFAPPITLSVGTYSPWNSQNTLFHKSAFHTLFLPTTVSFRTTDIWRSFISQKILHLSGLTVSFVPTNAVQFRNAHDYLKDFKDEKQVYEDSGRMIEFLHGWKCQKKIEDCMVLLAKDLVTEELWSEEDSELLEMFITDLKLMGFEFPELVTENYQDPYSPSTNESSRDVNCRRMNLEFELVDPREYDEQNLKKAVQKLNYFGDLVDWCNETGHSNLSQSFPSPEQLKNEHDNSVVLQKYSNSVLILVNNYPWQYGMGLLQRLYQPYFATVIFCGSWYPENIIDQDNYTSTLHPINYIHLNPEENHRGYFSYHCLTLVKEMGLSNVEGYFFVADDTVFNIWQQIDYSRVAHFTGLPAARNIATEIKNTTGVEVQNAWVQFEEGLRKHGYINGSQTAEDELLARRGKSISDFDYYATLMRVFYNNQFFLELAVNTILKSVDHQVSFSGLNSSLWKADRSKWDTKYSKDLLGLHPVKTSQFKYPGENRRRYCASILQTWSDIMFGGSRNFTINMDHRNGL
ncbi:hypothetical protein CAEBREN_24535 [Caenorhabditis brenneri]|uniref:Uncharacterized protein n=2 Tax=Caenorhabditis brenneri TaxID=135651 RepID=G0NE30_CAEBE|nr:hypothetical protein CAEBREN_24535 [Caenorhabditis brenneri]